MRACKRWSHGVDFFPWSFVPVTFLPWGVFPLLVLVLVFLNEVVSPLIHGDVIASVAKEPLWGSWSFLMDDPHQGLVLRSLVEVFYYNYLGDVEDVILHRLEPLEEGVERLAILSLDGLEVPWLCWLVEEWLEVGNESVAEVAQLLMQLSHRWQIHWSASYPNMIWR